MKIILYMGGLTKILCLLINVLDIYFALRDANKYFLNIVITFSFQLYFMDKTLNQLVIPYYFCKIKQFMSPFLKGSI